MVSGLPETIFFSDFLSRANRLQPQHVLEIRMGEFLVTLTNQEIPYRALRLFVEDH
jgi:hypothetical protein